MLVGQGDVPYLQSEGFQYVTSRAYRRKTGHEMPQGAVDEGDPAPPMGERIDHDDDELMRHFPRLVARFPQMGDG
jgi:hypothetical protein